MKKMKTFFIYFLLLFGFFLLSNFMQQKLILSMYHKIEGNVQSNSELQIEIDDVRATSMNGYMNMKITNTSNREKDKTFVKIEFLDKYNLGAMTKYATIENLASGESKDYKINFKGNKIAGYNVSLVSEIPDKSNILNLFGWEFDATNLFGLGVDITNINGVDLREYLTFEGVKKAYFGSRDFIIRIAESVPLWGYIIAGLIVIYYI